MRPAVRPEEIRGHNLSVILAHVHRDGELSRAELTQRSGLSRSTVRALVTDLVDLGLLEDRRPLGGSRVGRPSHVVAPAPDGPLCVGVDLDVEQVTIAAVGLGGVVRARRSVRTDGLTPEALATKVARTLPPLMKKAGADRGSVVGIGLSVPGTVDAGSGVVGVAPNLGWSDVPLGELVRHAVPEVEVLVGNDADLAVRAERQWGSARDCDDVVHLIGRVGVGAGIVLGGRPLRGRDGHAGEIGHNVLDPSGPPCHCGHRGCVETYLREDNLADPASTAQAADPLGRTIAMLVNTLNPATVVLGGSLTTILEQQPRALADAVAHYAFGDAHVGVRLVAPGLGEDSSLLGAADLAFAATLIGD